MSPVWVAHAARVLVSAARRNDLFWSWTKQCTYVLEKVRDRETRSPAREPRALPLTADATPQHRQGRVTFVNVRK
jgi:hypothetical protein